MRSAYIFIFLVVVLLVADVFLFRFSVNEYTDRQTQVKVMQTLVQRFGLSDLVIATEARYTRHPAVSDKMAPYMDHPGSIEHFPTGSFWSPPK